VARAGRCIRARFWALINSEWPGVVRSKGFFWLASRPTHAASWSQAGAVCRHGMAGLWWAAVPKHRWPTDEESLEFIEGNWDEIVGDAPGTRADRHGDGRSGLARASMPVCSPTPKWPKGRRRGSHIAIRSRMERQRRR
jgi:G3E family GTPase